jgi:hypothetical protein
MFRPHTQYLDLASGYHVIELLDEHGTKHLVQIAVGHEACPACGAVQPKNNVGEIDPKAAVTEVSTALEQSRQDLLEYAKKHGVRVKSGH